MPEIWIATLASGRSIAKLPTFETINSGISPDLKAAYSFSRSAVGVLPVISGAFKCRASAFSWSMYCPIRSTCAPRCFAIKRSITAVLAGFSEATRNFPRASAAAYCARQAGSSGTRTSTHEAAAMKPFCSSTFQGTS